GPAQPARRRHRRNGCRDRVGAARPVAVGHRFSRAATPVHARPHLGSHQGMKIRDVIVTPVAFPDPPLLNSAGVHEPWALRTVVQVVADSLVGLGETYGDAPHLALVESAARQLIGLDIFDLSDLRARVARGVGVADAPDKHGLTGASSIEKTLARVVS